MIKPTVGRVVWFFPISQDQLPKNGKEPLAAMITCVWSDTCVNLVVFDANGHPHGGYTSVLLHQEGSPIPDGGYYATWMPYQKAVASGQIPPTLHADPKSDDKGA